MTEESRREFKDEEVEAIADLVENLSFEDDGNLQLPQGMTMERAVLILAWQQKQATAAVFATLDEAFGSDWTSVEETDFYGMIRDRDKLASTQLTNETVKDVYSKSVAAAVDEETGVANSPSTMSSGDARAARLCKHVELTAEAAHLCPKTGPDCKTDTWLYMISAVLGLPSETEHHLKVLVKATRGCIPPMNETGQQVEDEQQKNTKATMKSTGINRSPCNLMYMMEPKFIFDATACVFAIPIMTVQGAKTWNGGPYSVIILCDKEKNGKASAREIAQRLGLTNTKFDAASKSETDKAQGLLTQILKFSAYCLDHKSTPPTSRGAKLWKKYKESLETVRAFESSRTEDESKRNGIVVPVAKPLPKGKVIAKVDLEILNQGLEKVIYPDPFLLASKSAVNWTRKFGFQMMAEAEPQQEDWRREWGDQLVGKQIDLSSHDDSSFSHLSYHQGSLH